MAVNPRIAKTTRAKLQPSQALGAAPARVSTRGTMRREALLAAAAEVFLEHGFAAASIDEVVRRTGGSKASLYSYFGSKEGLFDAMVEVGCSNFLRDIAIPKAIEGNLEKTLIAFGTRFFDVYSDDHRVRLMRAIMAEATRSPHLASQFYQSGPERARAQLAAFFSQCHRDGLLNAPDADFIAIQFITLVKGHCQFRSLLGLSPLALDVSPKVFIKATVQLFLKGCALPTPIAARSRRS